MERQVVIKNLPEALRVVKEMKLALSLQYDYVTP